MQYTGIAAYPRRVSEYPISFLHITKIECFGIKGLLIAGNFILLIIRLTEVPLVNLANKNW
jgi:hypothetical protein